MPSEYERLGASSVDGQSRRVPVPQQALNMELLKLDGEAYWGVRESDDLVVVSMLYDPIQDDPEIEFLTSTVVEDDEDRLVTVPDAVFDHWDDVAGGGTAVTGGDELTFVTTADLQENNQMLVLPEMQVEDVLGES
ncbi:MULTISPECIES: hypothetical protein [Halorussus]|uniref:hypothetical protein n=1 Tax=Halorussus TaxID=1070314 RepID=UPI00209FC06C|nr:hypothetical protein [Halorussus vallis]USZ77181.1 hypothetical protein NGM07_07585 [Halorussus vallis]